MLVVVIQDTKASFSYTDLFRCLPGVHLLHTLIDELVVARASQRTRDAVLVE